MIKLSHQQVKALEQSVYTKKIEQYNIEKQEQAETVYNLVRKDLSKLVMLGNQYKALVKTIKELHEVDFCYINEPTSELESLKGNLRIRKSTPKKPTLEEIIDKIYLLSIDEDTVENIINQI